MSLKLKPLFLGLPIFAGLMMSPVSAAVIFADNFNTPAFPTGTEIVIYNAGDTFNTSPVTTATTTGWVATGAGIDHVSPATGSQGSDGGAWVDLNALNTGGLEIALLGAFTPGQSYTLSFYTNTGISSAVVGTQSFNVTVTDGSNTLLTQTVTPTPTANPAVDTSWQIYTFGFTAGTTNDIILKFASNGVGPVGSYLDQVVIQEGQIPESTTLILSGLGLLAMAGLRKHRGAQKG